jgi:hypothetical protein
MTREELIKKVALKMDEVSSSDEVIVPVGTGDNNPLYTQIDNLLNESVNDVLMKAPIYRIQSQIASLDTFTTKDIHAYTETRKAVVFSVPNDFIRFAQVNDDAFARPIVDLAIEGDSIDKRQHNKNLVAKNAKPVAVIGNTANGREISLYSYHPSDIPNRSVLYIKRYNNEQDTTADTDLDDYLIDVVSWTCAGKVFAAQGDINKGKICDENAAAIMI